MTAMTNIKNMRRLSFEDLKGLRAEGYIRDSTLDQSDGFGPEMQRKAIEAFARTYGLVLGNAWYTDFITGTSTLKRSGFRNALLGAQLNHFDILLIYHTSRFARNRADALRYKAELSKLGKILVFVSQTIISGTDNDFLNEGINEVLDEHYSRTLARFVADGLRLKHESGIANGVPPLGYRSEKLESGKRERKIPDPKTMPTLIALLKVYCSGQYSYQTLADHLNSRGYRNREGDPFTKGGVEHILSNRFYEGKAVYHPGEPDEETLDGDQEVPEEVKSLWLQCQGLKRQRTTYHEGRPRSERRAYPFSMVAICDQCGRHYGGKPVHSRSGEVIRRLCHGRPFCNLEPHSVRVENLMAQFHEGVLPCLTLSRDWNQAIISSFIREKDISTHEQNQARLERALANLRKQHLWGDISDEDYRRERKELERQYYAALPASASVNSPNLDRAAQLLTDLPALWKHPGTTDDQRESFVKEVFQQVRVRGSKLVAIEPKLDYQPLFAYIIAEGVRKYRGERI